MRHRNRAIEFLVAGVICAQLHAAVPRRRYQGEWSRSDIITAAVATLAEFPFVAQCNVYDAQRGNTIVSFLTASPGRAVGTAALASACLGVNAPMISKGPCTASGRKLMKIGSGVVFVGAAGASLFLHTKRGDTENAMKCAALIVVPAGVVLGRMLWDDRNLTED